MDEIIGLIEAKEASASFHYTLFERVNPERNEFKFYYLSWQATLFDTGAVVRLWGRKSESQSQNARPLLR